MKIMAMFTTLPFLFGWSFLEESNGYDYRNKPRVNINERSQGVEVSLSMCDYIDGDFRLCGLRLAMYNGRCIVQSNSYWIKEVISWNKS